MLTSRQQHFADATVPSSDKWSLAHGVTDREFRGWVREWFKEQVKNRAGDIDRRFARMVHLSATEVNHIVNDKRYPTWKQIAKVTEHLNVRADDFLLDIVKRARESFDRAAGVNPLTPRRDPLTPPSRH